MAWLITCPVCRRTKRVDPDMKTWSLAITECPGCLSMLTYQGTIWKISDEVIVASLLDFARELAIPPSLLYGDTPLGFAASIQHSLDNWRRGAESTRYRFLYGDGVDVRMSRNYGGGVWLNPPYHDVKRIGDIR